MATLGAGSQRPAGGPAKALGIWASRLRGSPPLRRVLAAGLLVFCLVVLGTSLLIGEFRTREITDARRDMANLNTVLAEATSRAIENVDLALAGLVEEFRLDGVEIPSDLRRLKSDKATSASLRARVAGLPQLSAISIVGVDGRLINYSRGFPIPDIDLSDRDHFNALKSGAVLKPYLSQPVQNRGTGEWSVYLARRLTGRDGTVAGFAYGAIDLAYFQRHFASLDLARGGSISLWHIDGTMFVRYPAFEGVGKRFDTPAFRGLTTDSPPLVYETSAGIDGRPRLVARRVISGFPVVSVISMTLGDILAEWRRQATVLALAGGVLALAVAAVVVVIAQQFRAYEDVADAMRDRAAALEGLKSVEAQLRQSQKLEAMGQLTSGVAHDFNNLLTVVLGNIDMIERKLPAPDPGVTRYLEGARAGAERAAALTQRLLAFSRREPLAPRILDLNTAVLGMADILRQTLGERMALRFDLAEGLPPILADGSGLESALLNLVVNARDALPGGGTVTVETRDATLGASGDRPERAGVLLAVVDTGTGMSPEVLARAFEPFFTTKDPGLGTGLGLAQVYGFVQQTEGTVAIESAPGSGTRVRLDLPAAPFVAAAGHGDADAALVRRHG